ncbi:MAG: hypothetical protein ACKVIW_14210, partial [bacterium]
MSNDTNTENSEQGSGANSVLEVGGSSPNKDGAGSKLVEIRGLARSFEAGGGQVDVLKGLDLDVMEGDRIAIVGQSGVGK